MFKSILQWSTVFLAPVGFICILNYFYDTFTTGRMWVHEDVEYIERYANTKIKQGRGGRSCRKIKIHAKINYPDDYDRDCFKKMKLKKLEYFSYIYGVYRCESKGIITEMFISPNKDNTSCAVATFYKSDNIPIGEAYNYDVTDKLMRERKKKWLEQNKNKSSKKP